MKPHRSNFGKPVTHGATVCRQMPVIYSAWARMHARCNNPNHPDYHYYGGRGIAVCLRWNDFENFSRDMGEHPGSGFTLDRINTNGDYEPSNCRWATWQQQQRNRRDNRLITANGKTQCVSAWAEELGIKRMTISRRLNQLGWNEHDALFAPVRKVRR